MKTAKAPEPSPSVRDADKLPCLSARVPCRGERASELRRAAVRHDVPQIQQLLSWPGSLEEEQEERDQFRIRSRCRAQAASFQKEKNIYI